MDASQALTSIGTALGGLLVALALYDLASTTVSISSGAGPVTARLSRWIWRLLLLLHRRTRRPSLLRRAGPTILFVAISTWVAMLIVGWSLIFGYNDTILTVQDGEPAARLGRLYYAAATVIGRGTTVAQPSGDLWRALEEIAGFTGVALLSLSIAYIIPVVQGVVFKRKLAQYVSTLGHTPEEVLDTAWNGTDLGDLHLHAVALTPMVADLAQRHLAYPIIHYFHSADRETAIGPAIVTLDEVLTMNARVVDPDHRLPDSATAPLRSAITSFLQTLERAFIDPVEAEVTHGDLEPLRDAGVPIQDQLPEDPFREVAERRQLLRGYLEHDGWDQLGLLPLRQRTEHDTEAA